MAPSTETESSIRALLDWVAVPLVALLAVSRPSELLRDRSGRAELAYRLRPCLRQMRAMGGGANIGPISGAAAPGPDAQAQQFLRLVQMMAPSDWHRRGADEFARLVHPLLALECELALAESAGEGA